MRLTYDADLLEGAVFLEAHRLRRAGQALLAARYERDRVRAYEHSTDPDARDTAFFELHRRWFRDFGLEDRLLAAINEFPVIRHTAATVLFRKSVSRKDEGAELFVRPDARNVALALRSERLFEPTFNQWLRHELCHIADMLDPAFAYTPEISLPDAPPAELNLLRDRYRVLWDITIDGRLGLATERPVRHAEFEKAFSSLPVPRRQELFAQLWGGRRPAHPELLALARTVRVAAPNTPGSSCPLCKFPTFAWAADPPAAAIRKDFPHWLPAHGCCARCAELYETRQLEQPATLYL